MAESLAKKKEEFRVKIRKERLAEYLHTKRAKFMESDSIGYVGKGFSTCSSKEILFSIERELKEANENIIERVEEVFEKGYFPLILNFLDSSHDAATLYAATFCCANLSCSNERTHYDLMVSSGFIEKLALLYQATESPEIQENILWAFANVSNDSEELKKNVFDLFHMQFNRVILNAHSSSRLLKTTFWLFEVQLNSEKFPFIEGFSKEVCLFAKNSLESAKEMNLIASILQFMIVIYNIETWDMLFSCYLPIELCLPYLQTESPLINSMGLKCLKAYSSHNINVTKVYIF